LALKVSIINASCLPAHIPLFLYPFLNTSSKTRPFEYLRLTSLGVIGALVKNDNTEVIQFLLSTEIVPLCLRIMESGSELSKTVGLTFRARQFV
jgi:CCR4-NOT transcription complex subunit 9